MIPMDEDSDENRTAWRKRNPSKAMRLGMRRSLLRFGVQQVVPIFIAQEIGDYLTMLQGIAAHPCTGRDAVYAQTVLDVSREALAVARYEPVPDQWM